MLEGPSFSEPILYFGLGVGVRADIVRQNIRRSLDRRSLRKRVRMTVPKFNLRLKLYLESKWPMIMSYFVVISGYLRGVLSWFGLLGFPGRTLGKANRQVELAYR